MWAAESRAANVVGVGFKAKKKKSSKIQINAKTKKKEQKREKLFTTRKKKDRTQNGISYVLLRRQIGRCSQQLQEDATTKSRRRRPSVKRIRQESMGRLSFSFFFFFVRDDWLSNMIGSNYYLKINYQKKIKYPHHRRKAFKSERGLNRRAVGGVRLGKEKKTAYRTKGKEWEKESLSGFVLLSLAAPFALCFFCLFLLSLAAPFALCFFCLFLLIFQYKTNTLLLSFHYYTLSTKTDRVLRRGGRHRVASGSGCGSYRHRTRG